MEPTKPWPEPAKTPKLTDEQVEAACVACDISIDPERTIPWESCGEEYKKDHRNALIAAAPYLQLPWKHVDLYETMSSCSIYQTQVRENCIDTAYIINCFIDARNAALTPTPVDLRREKINTVLEGFYGEHFAPEYRRRIADKIIAALDQKE